jgi:hypothetical protein
VNKIFFGAVAMLGLSACSGVEGDSLLEAGQTKQAMVARAHYGWNALDDQFRGLACQGVDSEICSVPPSKAVVVRVNTDGLSTEAQGALTDAVSGVLSLLPASFAGSGFSFSQTAGSAYTIQLRNGDLSLTPSTGINAYVQIQCGAGSNLSENPSVVGSYQICSQIESFIDVAQLENDFGPLSGSSAQKVLAQIVAHEFALAAGIGGTFNPASISTAALTTPFPAISSTENCLASAFDPRNPDTITVAGSCP